jgi:two-component system cell cycle response regulator DivK
MATILLVEDNEWNRDMLSRRLIRRGYKVIEAVNGREGLESARTYRPDLILMDVSLPEMDGWEATHLLKASIETQGIPILILTAHATLEDQEKSQQAGCDGFETKPLDFSRLIRKIESLLK